MRAVKLAGGVGDLVVGDCVEVMRELLQDNEVDAIVCDPPYGLGFMGRAWDALPPGLDWARECLRVLKPGGHLVAFGGQRTIHRLTCALEDAGFEIRDQLQWLQWQGFPKSLDVSKAIDKVAGAERKVVGVSSVTGGRKSAFAAERADSASGVFGDASVNYKTAPATPEAERWEGWGTALKPTAEPAVLARKPIEGTVAENVLKWGTGALNIDGCRIEVGDPSWPGPSGDVETTRGGRHGTGEQQWGMQPQGRVSLHEHGRWPANVYYCPKAPTKERERGLEHLAEGKGRANTHPTVKPIALMRWLVRLVTPPGGIVLDPFLGSGTTAIACALEGFYCLGIEKAEEYVPIIEGRVAGWLGDLRGGPE